ncbi:unnamed protein product [Sphagnum tenellum]
MSCSYDADVISEFQCSLAKKESAPAAASSWREEDSGCAPSVADGLVSRELADDVYCTIFLLSLRSKADLEL